MREIQIITHLKKEINKGGANNENRCDVIRWGQGPRAGFTPSYN